MNMTTLRDIAKKAGVSKATVSNVFTSKRKVTEETRDRILEISNELNYYPNKIAASLATKKTNILGLLLENSEDKFKRYYGDLINGVINAASQFHYRILLDTCNENQEQLHNCLISRAEPMDGSIIHGPLIDDMRMKTMLNMDIPFVVIGRPSHLNNTEILSVDVNNILWTYEMTLHLLKLGHKKIGFLNSKPNMTITFDRVKGYVKALNECGIEFDPSLVYNIDNHTQSSMVACSTLLENHSEITAFIASSDEVASGIYEVLLSKGCRIPEDYSVVALGGDDYIDKLQPRLTTLFIDYKMIGEKAVNLLVKRVSNEEIEEKQVIVNARILKGDSCKKIMET